MLEGEANPEKSSKSVSPVVGLLLLLLLLLDGAVVGGVGLPVNELKSDGFDGWSG